MVETENTMALMYSENVNDFLLPTIRHIRRGRKDIYYRSFNPDNVDLNRSNKNDKQFRTTGERNHVKLELKPYTDNEDILLQSSNLDEDYYIILTKAQKYMTKFHVPSCFYATIIGMKGKVKEKIEKDTSTTIKIPKRGETGDIVITGDLEQNVASARTRIHMMLINKRDQHPATHFLSIPVVCTSTKENFLLFKEQILKSLPRRGIDETIFQNPNKMHITLMTLVLLDDVEVDDALAVFYKAKEAVINPRLEKIGNIRLKIQGIEIMNDDPSEVNVLYGKVELVNLEFNSEFHKLINEIVDYFARKGLIQKQRENVKLHVTLMNSVFRNRSTNNQQDELNVYKGRRESFDASEILEKYCDFHFGEVEAENLHLSIRFTTGDDLYYKPVATISLRNS